MPMPVNPRVPHTCPVPSTSYRSRAVAAVTDSRLGKIPVMPPGGKCVAVPDVLQPTCTKALRFSHP